MKPSERIKELTYEICAKAGKHQPRLLDLSDALPNAIVAYLDEQQQAVRLAPSIAEVAGDATGVAATGPQRG